MNDEIWKGLGIAGIMIMVIVLIMMLMFLAVDQAARAECRALGFEWGTYTVIPMGVQCEYRLRVPLRDFFPPIDEGIDPRGESDDASYIQS